MKFQQRVIVTGTRIASEGRGGGARYRGSQQNNTSSNQRVVNSQCDCVTDGGTKYKHKPASHILYSRSTFINRENYRTATLPSELTFTALRSLKIELTTAAIAVTTTLTTNYRLRIILRKYAYLNRYPVGEPPQYFSVHQAFTQTAKSRHRRGVAICHRSLGIKM